MLVCQESSAVKPDLFGEIQLSNIKNSNMPVKINSGNIFPQIGSSETGKQFFKICLLTSFLRRGTTLAFSILIETFHLTGVPIGIYIFQHHRLPVYK